MPAAPSRARARASRYSVFGPPRPFPFRVTVTSPPDSNTAGGFAGLPVSMVPSASVACWRATSRASPSMASSRITAVHPISSAFEAAASRLPWGRATIRVSVDSKAGLPGFGVSAAADRRASATAAGTLMANFSMTSKASSVVVGSATVGPEAMTAGSSPGTSDINRLTMPAGLAAAARRPPLMALKCLRTQFISPMVAPDLSNAEFTACLSSRVSPAAGRVNSAEPPPEIRASNRSSALKSLARPRIRSAACRPAVSGTGCAASTISMRSHGTAQPVRVTTRPERSPSQLSSTARAMAADALPAPTTTVRPAGGAGRWGGTVRAGSAAAKAASKRLRRASWGLSTVTDGRFCRGS